MTCIEFQRWLDEGRPESGSPRMQHHRAGCSHCDRELHAAMEIERLLAVAAPVAASARLEAAVFETIHARLQRRGSRRGLAAFTQVMAEPVVPLSIALTVVAGWQSMRWTAAIRQATLMLDASGGMTVVHALVVAPLTLTLSWLLFRAVQQMTTGTGIESLPPP